MPETTLLLADLERSYVDAINAVLAAADDGSPDAWRWRGMAEAYRRTVERIRADHGLPAVKLQSAEWRAEHGVYSDEEVARFRRLAEPYDGAPSSHQGPDEDDCSCATAPFIEGPFVGCNVHGLPSAAWEQGYDQGRKEEHELHLAQFGCRSCGHPHLLHDVEDHEDAVPRCCVENCLCGAKTTGGGEPS